MLAFFCSSCTLGVNGLTGAPMEIKINLEDVTPIFTQLIMQIKQGVQKGELSAGDQLPSIRQLANDLDLNHKTVAKAYRLLERDSVIETRGYRGTFIHKNAKENSTIDLAAWVKESLEDLIKKYKEAGVTDSEIRIAFAELMNNRNL